MSPRRRLLRALLSGRDLERMEPQALASALVGHVAQVVGRIDPAVWESMRVRAEMPCEEPGCDCQTLVQSAWPAFERLRKDYREQVVTRGLS